MSDAPGESRERRILRGGVWLLLAAAAFTLLPLWLPIILAAWFAHLTRPVVHALGRLLGGRSRAAAWVVVLALLVILVPASVLVVSLISAATSFVRQALESPELRGTLQAIVSDGDSGLRLSDLLDPERIVALLREHGRTALGFIASAFGATSAAVVGFFVFFLAAHAFAHDGERQWRWLVERSPLEGRHLERMRVAFHQVGRGLIVGVGLTALVQAIVGTIVYTALGVPRAMLLGGLTFFAAFIPSFGTGIIWVPVAGGLLVSGHPIKALILAALGVAVIGTIDNVIGPSLQRWGSLDLPMFVLIITIFGGFFVFGAWGFVLGPLIIRLAREALDIAREEHLFTSL